MEVTDKALALLKMPKPTNYEISKILSQDDDLIKWGIKLPENYLSKLKNYDYTKSAADNKNYRSIYKASFLVVTKLAKYYDNLAH